jgi:hypothetical protein
MWRPAVARESRGACGGRQQGTGIGRGRERTTRGGHPSKEVERRQR